MSWASTAQVLSLTGVTVTDDDITQAQGLIDLYSGVTEDVEDLSARDTRLLRYAVSYQAVWGASQVDVLTRVDVSRIVQDGVDVTPSDADALILAPLARRALAGLSWNRRQKTHHVLPMGQKQYRTLEDFREAWMSDQVAHEWRPT